MQPPIRGYWQAAQVPSAKLFRTSGLTAFRCINAFGKLSVLASKGVRCQRRCKTDPLPAPK